MHDDNYKDLQEPLLHLLQKYYFDDNAHLSRRQLPTIPLQKFSASMGQFQHDYIYQVLQDFLQFLNLEFVRFLQKFQQLVFVWCLLILNLHHL